jgi:hypothetical protein
MNIFSVPESDTLVIDKICENCRQHRYQLVSSREFMPLIRRPILKIVPIIIPTQIIGQCMGCHDRKVFDLINEEAEIIPLPNMDALSIE